MQSSLYIRIFKSESVLEVWQPGEAGFELADLLPILAWSGALGPKLAEGDGQAPEGFYEVDAAALNPNSRFHRSFDLGFPNGYDRRLGRTGSHLMVHGGDQSEGCYAIGDGPIERLSTMVELATAAGSTVPVHCFPFRMTPENLALHADSEWIDFWSYELAPAYLWFEGSRRIPQVDDHYRMA